MCIVYLSSYGSLYIYVLLLPQHTQTRPTTRTPATTKNVFGVVKAHTCPVRNFVVLIGRVENDFPTRELTRTIANIRANRIGFR